MNDVDRQQFRHDKAAPYWAAALIVSGTTGVSTTFTDFGAFWNGYVLDITGPAWNYILVRRLAHRFTDNRWTRFFTPLKTLVIFVMTAYGIELIQYLGLYESTYDPWDLLAYVSLLIPIFLIDIRTRRLHAWIPGDESHLRDQP